MSASDPEAVPDPTRYRPGGAAQPLPVSELRDALAASRIRVLYQPIVPMRGNEPPALEVLARLDHPAHGIMAPDSFVPQIERAGLSWPLTEAVARRAFAEWGQGRLKRLGLSLSLNFPLDVLLMPAALAWLDQARSAARIPPWAVIVELTESQPVRGQETILPAIRRLRGAGYGLALDDVGPAHPDRRPLLALGFSSLKLDRTLVRESLSDARALIYLHDTVRAAHAAGVCVVAEGVADRLIWRRMVALGVDWAQGHFVGAPMTAGRVGVWLRLWRLRQARLRAGAA